MERTMIELWFWEIRDPLTGRRRKANYRMTDGDALERFGVDARKIHWTREVRVIDLRANTTGSFLRNVVGSAPDLNLPPKNY